jgi:hypothetical protein
MVEPSQIHAHPVFGPYAVDFDRWERNMNGSVPQVERIPITRYWLIPASIRPKMFTPHGTMTMEKIGDRTQGVWDSFYSMREIWNRSKCVPSPCRKLFEAEPMPELQAPIAVPEAPALTSITY